MFRLSLAVLPALGLVLLVACGRSPHGDALTVYSARQEQLIKPLFDIYTEQTGVRINYITDKAEALVARLAAEGRRSPADLLITVDAGNLWRAADDGLLQRVHSDALDAAVPYHLRDARGLWYGLSVRARTMVYAPGRVAAGELGDYEGLAHPRWRGRLCLRTSRKVYNQSLVASMIAHQGVQRTENAVRGWVANLAAPPFADDTRAILAVRDGICDVALVNSYYLGRLHADDPDFPVAIHWANQGGRGVHINISGAGILRHSPNPDAALAFMEWMVSDEAQGMISLLNKEYPVRPGLAPAPPMDGWGEYTADGLPVEQLGLLQAEAVRLMDRAEWR